MAQELKPKRFQLPPKRQCPLYFQAWSVSRSESHAAKETETNLTLRKDLQQILFHLVTTDHHDMQLQTEKCVWSVTYWNKNSRTKLTFRTNEEQILFHLVLVKSIQATFLRVFDH